MTIRFDDATSERNSQRSYQDCSGEVNGKPFRVQIDECQPPCWYGSDLDDDEKAEVLEAIESAGRS